MLGPSAGPSPVRVRVGTIGEVACRLLDDEAVAALTAGDAVHAMREAVRAGHAGQLWAPARVRAELNDLVYVFTVGALEHGPSGFRAYRAGSPEGDQLVAVWDQEGDLVGVIVGDELGARRTGALGAVATDALARRDARAVAVIGSGHQAWTQLWALTAVREVERVAVFSPNDRRRRQFAARAEAELAVRATTADTANAALAGAEVIILATHAASPVIDAGHVEPGAHVVTVGPKTIDRHETPIELAERASVISCDSPAQARAYGTPFFTGSLPLVDLGAILAGAHPGRQTPQEITLHCSVGLAGTEVLLAQRLLETAPV